MVGLPGFNAYRATTEGRPYENVSGDSHLSGPVTGNRCQVRFVCRPDHRSVNLHGDPIIASNGCWMLVPGVVIVPAAVAFQNKPHLAAIDRFIRDNHPQMA